MSATRQPYKGFKTLKMDPKFRVSIPSAWRPEDGQCLYLMFSKQYEIPVIKVLSQEAYDHRVNVIESSDMTPAMKIHKLGKLAMLCREATVNDQGKLLIPKELSEMAGIMAESEVAVVGRGIHFEVWSKPNFDATLAIQLAEEEDADLGIY